MKDKQIEKQIEEICDDFQYYDKYRCLPYSRKRIDITLQHIVIKKLKEKSKETGKAISRLIEEAVIPVIK